MVDFKIYLPGGETEENILVFHAWVADRDSYYLHPVPEFGIHDTFKKLFIDLLKGTLSTTEIDMSGGTINYIDNNVSNCENEDIEAYLSCAGEFLDTHFGNIVETYSFIMHQMIDLRFDGHDLNLEHGIEPDSAKKIYTFANDFVDIMQANNTDFGGVLQRQAQAGSTLIPFLTDQLDNEALSVIRTAIEDINNGQIDREFANGNDRFSLLYKKITKKIADLKGIKDLETFNISLYNTIGDQINLDIDLRQLAMINEQLYGNQINYTGTVRKAAYQLKSRPAIHSAEVDINGKVYSIHLNTQNESFEVFKRRLRENEGRRVSIDGYQIAERTIEASHISVLQEEEDLTTTPPAE